MKNTFSYDRACSTAERVIRDHNITSLPVDPLSIADQNQISVVEKPISDGGVSGMLIRYDSQYCIAYATHIKSAGFQRFTICHELGHYFIEGHPDAVFREGDVHESRSGFVSSVQHELEADHFAARLLMPNALFSAALRRAGEGLGAVEALADICITSLPATAIRYAQMTRDPVAIIVSTGQIVDYCFMSPALRELDGIDWIQKGQLLPKGSPTSRFNIEPDRVRLADKIQGESGFQDWFGGSYRTNIAEDVVGLGGYGKTLTVLHEIELPEEVSDDEADIEESWTPRFRG